MHGAAVLTGANAVPTPSAKARAQQIAVRVKAQRGDIRLSFEISALSIACPIEPPLPLKLA